VPASDSPSTGQFRRTKHTFIVSNNTILGTGRRSAALTWLPDKVFFGS